jgi:hypothetical protein
MKAYFILFMLVVICCPYASPAQQGVTPEDMINALKGNGEQRAMPPKQERKPGANPAQSASKERGGGALPGSSLVLLRHNRV